VAKVEKNWKEGAGIGKMEEWKNEIPTRAPFS